MSYASSIKTLIFGPTLEQQRQKWNHKLRQEVRALEGQERASRSSETKAKEDIKKIVNRMRKNPQQAQGARLELKIATKTYIDVKKRRERVEIAKTQMESIQRQVANAFAMRKIQAGMKSSTVVIKEVNSLIRMPEMTAVMNQLSQELMKAGIIEEMMEDSIPDLDVEEEEETEDEMAKVLEGILKEDGNKYLAPEKYAAAQAPSLPSAPVHAATEYEAEDIDLDTEDMQRRLEALKS